MGLIISIDLRPIFGAVRDQGARPTCIAFAFSDAHAAARGPFVELSAEHLFYHGAKRTKDWRRDEGIGLTTAIEALLWDGQAEEVGWRYLDQLPSDLARWTPPQTAMPIFTRRTAMISPAVQEIIENLDAGTPVVIVLMISEAFCEVKNGLIEPTASDPDVDWHAIIAVGYTKNDKGLLILIRNSWGADWGAGGYAWVHADYLTNRLSNLVVML